MDHNVDNKDKNVNNMPQDVMAVFTELQIVGFSPVRADIEIHCDDYHRLSYLYNAGKESKKY